MKKAEFQRTFVLKSFVVAMVSILCVLNHAPAYGASQQNQTNPVTLKANNIPLTKALDLIASASKMKVIYSPDEMKSTKTVSLRLKDTPAKEAVEQVIKDQNMQVSVDNDRLIITKNQTPPQTKVSQKIEVTGTIKDKAGNTLPGVNILIRGSQKGKISDANGAFSIECSKGDILQFSFIGYNPVNITVRDNPTINVVLTEAAKSLDEVVVIGYGTTSQKNLGSAVSTVKMDKISNLPVPSVTDALAGRTQGIIVTNSGGGPGRVGTLSIRGGDEPLFVIDGVVQSLNYFNNLNPNDIENFTVLKDASATAIYGARAGNGIVVVTTKRGKAGVTTFNFSTNQSWARPTTFPQKISSYERALITNEMNKNENQPISYSDEVLKYYRDQTKPFDYPNVDWQKLTMKNFAPESRYDLSATGGNDQTQFYVGLSAYNQGTILKTDHQNLNRYTYRINIVNDFKNLGLKMTAGADGFIQKQIQPNSGYGEGNAVWSHIVSRKPWEGAYNDLGLYLAGTPDHPLVELDSRSGYTKNSTRDVNATLNFEYSVPHVDGLVLKSNNTYSFWNSAEKKWNASAPQSSLGSTVPVYANNPSLNKNWGEGSSYNIQGMAEYKKTLGDHNIDALVGAEQSAGNNSDLSASRTQYQIYFDQFNAGPIANMNNGSNEYENARAGYFGRLKYSYMSKYLAEGTFRYDGSDNFPKGKRWGFFYAGNAAWTISEENFMRDIVDAGYLSYLKFRVSYGLTGLDKFYKSDNRTEDRFSYIPGYSIDGTAYYIDGGFKQGFSEGDLVNTNISWYKITTLNYGLDAAFFNNKLSLSWDYFYYRQTGYIASPSSVGYTDPLGKSLPKVNTNGASRRAGTEFLLSYKDKIGKLSYEVGGTFTYFNELWERNPYEDLSDLKNPYTRTTQRTDYSGIMYYSQGYYSSPDDIINHPKRQSSTNITAGDLKYLDFNGDGKIDGNDQVPVGSNAFPRINYGLTIDLNYSGLSLNALFRGSGNRDVYLGQAIQAGVLDTQVLYQFQKDYWTPQNTNAKFPRLVSTPGVNGNNNFVSSDHWLINGRYFRLSNLQIGYDLKYSLLKQLKGISSCSIVFAGTNLFTISKLMKYYMDPETASNNNWDYPVQQVYSVGLRLSF